MNELNHNLLISDSVIFSEMFSFQLHLYTCVFCDSPQRCAELLKKWTVGESIVVKSEGTVVFHYTTLTGKLRRGATQIHRSGVNKDHRQ